MDGSRFDALVRSLTARVSRRAAMRGLFAVAGLDPARAVPTVSAGKRGKRPLQRNAFGCVPVGKPCRGKDGACCSGVCRGKTPKKGEKDKSRCAAHDTGGCVAGQGTGFCGGSGSPTCVSATGATGNCQTTTGNAGYCRVQENSVSCARDADCQASFGPRAACIVCTGLAQGTLCVGAGGP